MNYKHVIHLAMVAHSYYFISVCGIRINYPLHDGSCIMTFKESDELGLPRRVGELKEVNCKACQRTWIYKAKLKHLIVPVLMKGKT